MNNNSPPIGRYLILFIPWLLATWLSLNPVLSYLIAWLGSFFIFYVTLTGKIKKIPDDRTFNEQLMRPLFIVQIIFAGYMCCTTIFYFLNTLGYEYLTKTSNNIIYPASLEIIARCQRYYCLGHAAFATGLLVFMKYPANSKYFVNPAKLANLLVMVALISFPVSIIFRIVPGLSQFYFQLSSLSFIAGTLALAFAIPLQKFANTLICLTLYCFNFHEALISGYKEPIIISVLVLAIFLYSDYKKIVIMVFFPIMIILFVFLPTYVTNYRSKAWTDDVTADNASQQAFDATMQTDNIDETNWSFLVYRLSEIDMFTDYVQSTPSQVDYYGLQLVKQSIIAIIPRVLWPSKPVTERVVMERVYAAGAANPNSSVSAKPAYIVDAYLSYGPAGIFIYLFIYGAVTQLIAIKAERLFGGYILGAALIFSGLFQILWRGLSFEFIVNSVFWSYITMLLIFHLFKKNNVLTIR